MGWDRSDLLLVTSTSDVVELWMLCSSMRCAMFSCLGRVDHVPCSADHTPVSYQKMENAKKAFADCTTPLLLFQFLSKAVSATYLTSIALAS
jgi:hypothetical protein